MHIKIWSHVCHFGYMRYEAVMLEVCQFCKLIYFHKSTFECWYMYYSLVHEAALATCSSDTTISDDDWKNLRVNLSTVSGEYLAVSHEIHQMKNQLTEDQNEGYHLSNNIGYYSSKSAYSIIYLATGEVLFIWRSVG